MPSRQERRRLRRERAKGRADKMTKEKEASEKLLDDPFLQPGYKLAEPGHEDDEDVAVALVSWVGPTANQKSDNVAINFHGYFRTEKEGEPYMNRLRKERPKVDLYWVLPGKYIILPPPREMADAIPMKYNDPKMNEIMSRYYEDQKRNRLRVEQRMKAAKAEARKKARAARKKRGPRHSGIGLTERARAHAQETAKQQPTLEALQRAQARRSDGAATRDMGAGSTGDAGGIPATTTRDAAPGEGKGSG